MEILDQDFDKNQDTNPVDRQGGMWPHLIGLLSLYNSLLGLIGTIIYYFINKEKGNFVKEHSLQALNFQIGYFGFSLLFGLISALIIFSMQTDSAFSGASLVIILSFGLAGINLVMCIIGAVKANNGEYWKNPLVFPFVKE